MRIVVETLFELGEVVWAGDDLAEIVQVNYNVYQDERGRIREHVKYKVKFMNKPGHAWFNGKEISHR